MQLPTLRHLLPAFVAAPLLLAAVAQAALTPPSTGLQAWYKADAGVTVTGSGVSLWEDQTANNNDATQGTDGARPALSSAAMPIGGAPKPVITYGSAGGYDQLNLPAIDQDDGTGATVYIVVNDDADTGAINKNWLNRNVADGGVPFEPAIYGAPNSTSYDAGLFYDSGWFSQVGTGINGWKVASFAWTGGGSTTLITNFVSSLSASSLDGPDVTLTWSSIGFTGADQQTFASFAELLIYNRALSPAEDAQALTYLNSRYFTFIPEPASGLLVGLAAAGILLRRRR